MTLQFNNRFLMASNSSDLETKRMLFPMTDAKSLPLTQDVKGAGLFYHTGLMVPRPVYFPNMAEIDIPKVVKRLVQENSSSNKFIKENYWEEP
ncbi:hypothetical protein J2Z60_000470 [Lactobacillus colini]|uniref:Uncharacterized protein n=1 Tax=Lactobacillus colini TaxID=1819254 RepID=A0ABS4MC93_9LACO|nr:hypothetical protein [Lactobacillus colini]MBP2057306.1 hypothetical protein [Lactobacillus colini]